MLPLGLQPYVDMLTWHTTDGNFKVVDYIPQLERENRKLKEAAAAWRANKSTLEQLRREVEEFEL